MNTLFKTIRRTYIPTSVYKMNSASAVYFELQGQTVAGKVRIKLYDHEQPEGSENFRKVCEGFTGKDGKKLTYKGVRFTNQMKDFFMETEDLPQTVFGEPIPNESYQRKFDRAGLVGLSSDIRSGREESGSGFFITLRDMPNLSKHVVIGEVIEGLELLKLSDKKGEQLAIKDCGYEGDIGAKEPHGHDDHGHH